MWEKNRLFEEQNPAALAAMRQINQEMDGLMEQVVKELAQPPEFLPAVQQSILKCLGIEKKAFQVLDKII